MEMGRLETRLLRSAMWRVLTERVTIPWVLRSASRAGESLELLELGSGPGAATREAHRVLRPGGTLILADLLHNAFRGPGQRLFPPAMTYELDDLLAEIAAAGFATTVVRPVGSLGYRLAARVQPGAPSASQGRG
jgi:SAM-dependent methyltransferase